MNGCDEPLNDTVADDENKKILPRNGVGFVLLLSVELVFSDTAEGTFKIFGNIFPSRTSRNACIGYANGGIIHPTAYFANVFAHNG